MKQFLNFINGEFVATAKTFDNRNPATNEVVGQVHEAGQAEVDAAVAAGRAALKGEWGQMSVVKRAELLHAVADEINRRFDDFLAAELADTGKPRSLASHIDIPRGAANFKIFADIVKNVPTESFHMTTPDGSTAISYGLRTPLGVVGVICPWNLPLLLMTWKVGPALACGNTVIVKPSEETPATATLLGEVMNAVGIPRGVYNVVHGLGPGAAGEFLTTHPGVDGITFTGETRTGEAIMKAAANGVRPVSLELGGKNAGVIFDDADLDAALEGIGRACFANSGQVCLGTERLYVQRGIYDRFCAGMAEKAKGFSFGDPYASTTTMGPVISAEHRDKVLSYYGKARAAGAEILAGGGVPDVPGLDGGYFVQPTVWTGLGPDASVITDEIFGPCTHITPFDSEEEGLALANASPYGLATSIWTTNLARAHRSAAQIEVGIAWVNSWFLRDLRTPFGGSKASGIGREGGIHSMEFYTELRNICIKL